MLAATRDRLPEIANLLSPHGLAPRWFTQPALQSHFQTRLFLELTYQQLQSISKEMKELAVAFELQQFGPEPTLTLFHHSLGIREVVVDQAGEVLLRSGQVEAMVAASGGNFAEFQRLLRHATALSWFDLIEPLRLGKPRFETMLRAV